MTKIKTSLLDIVLTLALSATAAAGQPLAKTTPIATETTQTTRITASAAANPLTDPAPANSEISTLPADAKLAPRTPLTPYASREAALRNDPADTPWLISITDWQREALGAETRYSARVKIPRSWDGRAVILRAEGVTASFEIAVNGTRAGYSRSGMGNTEFDLTDLVRQDYNDITIAIYGNSPAREVECHRLLDEPAIGSAALISQPMVRIRDLTVETSVEGGRGLLSLAVITRSHLRNPKDCTVSYELLSPEGFVVAQASRELTTGWMSEDTLRFATAVDNVRRWNHETPNLYTIVAKIFQEERFTEYIAARIGFRRVSYGNENLLVDGVEIPLYNTAFVWQGDDVSTRAGLRSLRERGFNCVTTPGYPQPESFYRACDEVGMYVCNVADINTGKGPQEITRGGNRSNDPAWLDVFLSRAMEMFYSSRLHPSVVMLSPATGSPNGFCLYESYLALKKAGMGRPVVYPEAGGQWNNDPVRVLPIADRKSPISIDGTGLSVDGAVYVENNMSLTQLQGTATYRILQNGSARHTASVAIDLPPGGRLKLSIPPQALSKARKEKSLEVSISVNRPDLGLPDRQDNDKRPHDVQTATIARANFRY